MTKEPAMKRMRIMAAVAVLVAATRAGVMGPTLAAAGDGERPGSQGGGTVLLPNGWTIAPAGRHLPIGELPLAMIESPDGRYLAVTTSGYAKPALVVVDLQRRVVASRLPVDHAWLGLAWHPDGKRLFSSGAGSSTVNEYLFAHGTLRPGASYPLAKPSRESFVGGLAVSPDGERVFAVQVLGQTLSVIDLAQGGVLRTVELAAEPYTCLLSADGGTLFVSLWGGAKVLVFDAATLAPRGEIAVGEHPNAMVLARDGNRLFVACANTNSVWVVDVAARTAREQIGIALYPEAPPGSTPNALDLSRDGRTLLVANADNNTVAVVDVAEAGHSEVEGFIPTGWYPTAARTSADGQRVYVLSGKGLSSMPNPRGPQPGALPSGPHTGHMLGQYAGSMLTGSLSIVDRPDAKALAAYTKKVYAVTPYADRTRLAPASAPANSPIPRRVGEPSPIEHVFYVIRENRTYDQVFGDIAKGNGDPNLCLFGEEVTPNAHALAEEFVLLDNFYVDAEVSFDGHSFSTAAYATDFTEKVWPMNYGQRGAKYMSEGGAPFRNPYGNITAPAQGYIWDACRRAGVSVRSYGEFAVRYGDDRTHDTRREASAGSVEAAVPGLEGLIHPEYPPYDLTIPDNRRVDVWLEEFRAFEAKGGLPRLSIIRLGNDHTAGTRPGYPTPRAMVAENDLALGRMVEAISHSRYWQQSAIFVLEDDAQNGPDHVDAHRSVALVVSPYVRRGAVDSTLYTTSGMLRTIELILGLPPMSQYDAAATPMYGAFQSVAVSTPFAKREARVPLDEKNAPAAPGAAASLAMNLEEADRAPDLELNEIIWKAVRGASSVMPPPVRAAFVKRRADDDDKDEER